MKNIIITGGAGFIGSSLVNFFLKKKNYYICIIDDLSTGKRSNINFKNNKIKFIKGDCSEDKIINKIPKKKYDVLFHIAGQSSGEISFDDPSNDLNRNLLSTVKLAQFCLKNKVKKIVYASSMSVYGNLKNNNYLAKVNDSCEPLSFYGLSKLSSENYLKLFSKQGLKYSILRLFNVYGANQDMKNLRQGMISIYLAQLLKSNTVIVKGSLKRFRDFIYIDDVVSIFYGCYMKSITNNKIYNVSTGVKTSVREVLKILSDNLNLNIKIIKKQGTPGDQFGIFSNSTDLKRTMKLKNFIPIFTGIKKMIKSHKK
ncbi:NAD-dependent epimerase/dehydratase family protein [Pelagibacterales bacterium SAG-MED35]|nr:NAD-dependent epimerase/dehydratase family protein [Pelagibacterales bacterium SAG-MED35]